MNNFAIIIIYTPFAIISTAILVIELLRRFKRQEDRYFTLLCLCSVCWYVSNITALLTNSAQLARFLINFILIFVGFIPPVLLLFVLGFYRVSYRPSTRVTTLLLIVPFVNTVMSLTSLHHPFLNKRLEIISLSPVREMILTWGPWFWVHTAYCYIVSVAIIGTIMYQHFHMPKFYRLPSTMMVVGVSLTLVGNVITLLQLLPAAIDPTVITMSLSLIFFHLAIINNNRSKFVRFSRGQIYHYLDLFIFVLNERHQIVDINRPAIEWFSSQGISISSLNYSALESVIETLLRNGGRLEDDSSNEEGVFIHYSGVDFPMVLSLRKHEIVDARGEAIGSIAVFTDVTQNRMLIDRLEAKAGMDPLTGLANRMAYEGAKKRLDTPEYLPLSVIMCDVNGLKYVNDNLGHKYGDMMLQAVSKILEDVCPRECFVARIGGDEFIYLLPCTQHEAALALIKQINEALARCKNNPFVVSAALGTATKSSADENLNDVIALADSRMYGNKKQMKGQDYTARLWI